MNSGDIDKEYVISPKTYRQVNPWQQLGLLVLYAVLGFVMGNIVAVIPLLLGKVPMQEWAMAIGNPRYASIVIWVQVLSSIVIFGIPVFLFALKNRQMPGKFYRLDRRNSPVILLLVILLALAAMPVSDLLATVTEHIPLPASLQHYFQSLEDSYNTQMLALLQLANVKELLISLAVIAFLPAVMEELFFRGALQKTLIAVTKSPWAGIVLTSAIFSAVHMSYYGFLPRFFLGMLLGYVYLRSQNMRLNILIHFLNNAISVIGMYVLYQQHKLDVNALTDHLAWPYQMFGAAGLAILLFFFGKKISADEKDNSLL